MKTRTRRYFAADNHYSSQTSIGFVNTWYVVAFASPRDRDAWVESRGTLAARALRKDEVTHYLKPGRSPEPFSGEYWGIVDNLLDIPGYMGSVQVCEARERLYHCMAQRLYA